MTKDDAGKISQWLLDWHNDMRSNTMTKNEEIDLLQQALIEAQADTRRIDWLADPNNHIGLIMLPHECVRDHIDSPRDAIDAAMALPPG